MTTMKHLPQLEKRIEIKLAMDRVGDVTDVTGNVTGDMTGDVTGTVRRPAEGSPHVEWPRIEEGVTGSTCASWALARTDMVSSHRKRTHSRDVWAPATTLVSREGE